MPEWYWALRGWELAGVTLAGIAVALVSVGSIGMLIVSKMGKVITGAMAHEQATCPCWDCRRRRAAATNRRMAREYSLVAPPTHASWKSTAELEPGTYVSVKGETYFVKNIHTNIKGYIIELRNLKNRKEVIVTVKFQNANIRYWRPLGYWEKR